MRASYEKISVNSDTSFLARRIQAAYFDAPLHFHPEYELTLIISGNGKRFVGDSVENFKSGDLVLLGSNLPHFWRSDKPSENISEAIVIQFSTEFVENFLGKLPECKEIISMLTLAKSGIKLNASFAPLLEDLINKKGLTRLTQLINLLGALSQSTDYQILASEYFNIKPDNSENERMRKVLEFTLDNFPNDVSINVVADLANLTVPSFCRYFKTRTQKTYVDYLHEIRVNHARKLLIENKLSISQIGLECGFQNLSNFHRIFKKQVGLTPLAYRKHF